MAVFVFSIIVPFGSMSIISALKTVPAGIVSVLSIETESMLVRYGYEPLIL